ncbi:hypothetical protein F4810DRAFT_663939 [Camillea tinctor]|nr:hypothetical protein F4810DRAFT_663939 [Camillea tinctor]
MSICKDLGWRCCAGDECAPLTLVCCIMAQGCVSLNRSLARTLLFSRIRRSLHFMYGSYEVIVGCCGYVLLLLLLTMWLLLTQKNQIRAFESPASVVACTLTFSFFPFPFFPFCFFIPPFLFRFGFLPFLYFQAKTQDK